MTLLQARRARKWRRQAQCGLIGRMRSSALPSRLSQGGRQFVALAVAGFALVFITAGGAEASSLADGCTCADRDLAEYAAEADAVFSGTLTAVRLLPKLPDAKPGEARPVRYVVAVEKLYKGILPATTVRVESKAVRPACQLDQLPVGKRYAFFADLVDGTPVVKGQCSGTQPLTSAVLAELETVFAPPPTPDPEPITATRTLVDDSEPVEFARLAAPGAALVIVGALGLALVGRLTR